MLNTAVQSLQRSMSGQLEAYFGYERVEAAESLLREWRRVDRTIAYHLLLYGLLFAVVSCFLASMIGFMLYKFAPHLLQITAGFVLLALLPPSFPSIFAYAMGVALTLHELVQININLLVFAGLQLAIWLNRYVLPQVVIRWTMLAADMSVGGPGRDPRHWTELNARRWQLLNELETAENYGAWRAAARELDRMPPQVGEGGDLWRSEEESTVYDSGLVKDHVRQLRKGREVGDAHMVAGLLRAVLHRNFAGVDDLARLGQARTGTKRLVEAFRAEVANSVAWLLSRVDEEGGLTSEEMRQLVREARRSQGRTALCLSGGGALAMFHFGAVKELLKDGLLPEVVSGTSGGSIVAGFMSMYTDEELKHEIREDISNRYGVKWFEPKWHMMMNYLKHGTLMDAEKFEETTKAYYGDLTFQEAFNHSGRIVSIQVSVGKGHGLVLNHVTAPKVLIRSAVCASCALPGLMRPHALLAKTQSGDVVQFHPPGVASFDGTYTNDIPSARLTELFDCNHFIVSQVNPHVNLYLQLSEDSQKYLLSEVKDPVRRSGMRKLQQIATFVKLNVKYSIQKLLEMNLFELRVTAVLNKLLMQTYSGHITLLPRLRASDYLKILRHPTEHDMRRFIDGGARSVWPLLDHIRGTMAMELVLQAASSELETTFAQKANADNS